MIIQTNHLDLPALQLYAQRRESDLKHACEPEPGLFIAESMKVIRRALEAGYEPVSFLCAERFVAEIQELLQNTLERKTAEQPVPEDIPIYTAAESVSEDTPIYTAAKSVPEDTPIYTAAESVPEDIPIYTAAESVLEEIAGYHLTGGALAMMRRRKPAGIDAFFSENDMHRIVVLEHVVNPTNLGAITRSAAALGMDAVLFTPDCADPLYRRAIRVSMGTIFQIPWTFIGRDPADWYQNGPQMLRDNGWHTVAMALCEDSVRPDDPRFQAFDKLAVIMGTEGEGLAGETIRQCDDTVMIPMMHGVDSLNVGAAAAVAFWNFRRQI